MIRYLVGGCARWGVAAGLLGSCRAPEPSAPPGAAPPSSTSGSTPSSPPPSSTPTITNTTIPYEGPWILSGAATSLGTDGFSANGRVQPRGQPGSWYFEYGPTGGYGYSTPVRPFGPQKTAHYLESWDDGLASWNGGFAKDLAHVAKGGVSNGYVRYTEPTSTDTNHIDGIGELHLVQYFYPGLYDIPGYNVSAYLGGGDPDFTDAQIDVWVQGTDWEVRHPPGYPQAIPPFYRGDELVWWSQADATEANDFTQMSNWAYTGFYLTDALYSGDWTQVVYTLDNDSTQWSYAGQNRLQMRDTYIYAPIGDLQRHLDVNVFHNLLLVDYRYVLKGSIGFDELHLTYRNHNVLIGANGGALAGYPTGSKSDPAALTDGYRFGAGHTWQSEPYPAGPQQFDYALDVPVTVHTVQVHNDPESPSADVEVYTSLDGQSWALATAGRLPRTSPHGANFLFLRTGGLAVEASHVRVVVLNGYEPATWGLGEIEVFGDGAVQQTDDAWYPVTADITGLAPGDAVHWRLVADVGGETLYGPDQVYVVPTGEAPEVVTGVASSVDATHLRVTGTLNTLGSSGFWWFDVGADASYGLSTFTTYTGPEVTPRRFSQIFDLDHPDLAAAVSAGELHYRLVYCAGCDTVELEDDVVWYGADASVAVP